MKDKIVKHQFFIYTQTNGIWLKVSLNKINFVNLT